MLLFPPSRQHVLANLPQFENLPPRPDVPTNILYAQPLPTTRHGRLSHQNLYMYTPTQFTPQQIKAIGPFPDYALLSGVPHPEPCNPTWELSKAVFRPFRPFKPFRSPDRESKSPAIPPTSPHHIDSRTPDITRFPYDPNHWIELTHTYHPTMTTRHALLPSDDSTSKIIFQHPSPTLDIAARELMEALLQFLTLRYPSLFSLSHSNTRFHNTLLGTTTDLLTTPPLRVIFDHVPEDFLLLLRNDTHEGYYVRGAVVCPQREWDLQLVSDRAEWMIPRLAQAEREKRYWFEMGPTDEPRLACTWTLEDGEDGACEGEVGESGGRRWERSLFKGREGEVKVGDVRLRCEVQTFRRLPLSGAVVCGIKTVFTRLEELRDEPFVPALLGKVLRGGDEKFVRLKCEEHVERVALEALDGWAAEQVEAGVVPADWEATALDESPFYAGWEEKWLRQQGLAV